MTEDFGSPDFLRDPLYPPSLAFGKCWGLKFLLGGRNDFLFLSKTNRTSNLSFPWSAKVIKVLLGLGVFWVNSSKDKLIIQLILLLVHWVEMVLKPISEWGQYPFLRMLFSSVFYLAKQKGKENLWGDHDLSLICESLILHPIIQSPSLPLINWA